MYRYKLSGNQATWHVLLEWELGVVVSELGSQPKGCGFESRLFQIIHGNGVKSMPGWIPFTPNPGSETENKEI